MKALQTADSLKMYGERYSWFVGTKTSNYSFNASCCADMKVLTFHPQPPSSSELRIMKESGLHQEPLLESAFYADLAAKTLAAVANMKKGKLVVRVELETRVVTAMFRGSLARDDLHQVQPVLC